VSDRHLGFVVQGPGADVVLNAGCPLDLHASGFPVGMCTRTVFEKAEILLWRTEPLAFRLELSRSFAPYLETLLAEAITEIGG
jgi:sarcosine oxidase subunit gamma